MCPEILLIAGDFNFHLDDLADRTVARALIGGGGGGGVYSYIRARRISFEICCF